MKKPGRLHNWSMLISKRHSPNFSAACCHLKPSVYPQLRTDRKVNHDCGLIRDCPRLENGLAIPQSQSRNSRLSVTSPTPEYPRLTSASQGFGGCRMNTRTDHILRVTGPLIEASSDRLRREA